MGEYRTRPGRLRPILAISVAVLAVLAALVSGAPPGLKLGALILIALAACRALVRAPGHVIRLDPDAGPALDGVRGTLFAEAATGLFVALRLTPPVGQPRRALVFSDELEPEAFRALLAFLRHG